MNLGYLAMKTFKQSVEGILTAYYKMQGEREILKKELLSKKETSILFGKLLTNADSKR